MKYQKSELTGRPPSLQGLYYICQKGELCLHEMKLMLEQRPYEGPYTCKVCLNHSSQT